MDRLSLLNYRLRCTGMREERSIVLFVFGRCGKERMFYHKESSVEETVPR